MSDRLRRDVDPLGTRSAESPFMNITTYARHGDIQYASKTAAGCENAGEPVFVLRAQDATAALAIRFWASLNDGTIADEALQVAERFEAWPVKKKPD